MTKSSRNELSSSERAKVRILIALIFLLSMDQAVAAPERRLCNYQEQVGCEKEEVCVYAKSGAFCQELPKYHPSVRFPFSESEKIYCDQGSFSPAGDSHSYSRMVFALDLYSERKQQPATVLASRSGFVYAYDQCVEHNTDCGDAFGNLVKIFSEDGTLTFYAHLEKVFVKTGDKVQVGQKIGIEGNTGWTGLNNRHLHYSVHYDWRKNGRAFYEKYIGALPKPVPFKINACQKGQANCANSENDVREIRCRRITRKPEPLQAL